MLSQRLEKRKYGWPAASDGKVTVSPAKMSMLFEGFDWRAAQPTWRPLTVGILKQIQPHRIHITLAPD